MLVAMAIVWAASASDPVIILVNYGALGIMLILFVLGRVHSDTEVKDLKDQNRRMLEALTNLQVALTRQTLPAMTRSTEVLAALPSSDEALTRELQRLVSRLETIAGDSSGGGGV